MPVSRSLYPYTACHLMPVVQCIGEAFGVDPSDEAQCKRLSVKPATLPSIFDVFVKTREKMSTTGTTASASTSAPAQPKAPSTDDKAAAEKLKAQGNAKMSSKEYDAAVDFYTQAIVKDGTNAVYYSNRAAAYSSKSDHVNAVKDAEKALEVDPSFIRAYHRLGLAFLLLASLVFTYLCRCDIDTRTTVWTISRRLLTRSDVASKSTRLTSTSRQVCKVQRPASPQMTTNYHHLSLWTPLPRAMQVQRAAVWQIC